MKSYTDGNGLIGADGRLSYVGCSDTHKYSYDRMNVNAPDIAIKESDSYTVCGDSHMLRLTSADHGYRSFISAEYSAGEKHIYKEFSLPLTMGSRSHSDTRYKGEVKQNIKDAAVSFIRDGDGGILIRCFFPKFDIEKPLVAEISMKGGDLLCAFEPFEYGRRYFYCCENNVGMNATGIIRLGDDEALLNSAFGAAESIRCVIPAGFRRVKAVACNGSVSLVLSEGGTYEETRYENALFINGKAFYLTAGDISSLFSGCVYTVLSTDNNKAEIVFKAVSKPFRNNSGIFGYTDTVSGIYNISFLNENHKLYGFLRKSFTRF